MLREKYEALLRKVTLAALGIKQSVKTLSTKSNDDHCLTVFFDTALMHVTYDFLWYMNAADTVRKKKGLKSTQLVITDINSKEAFDDVSYRKHVTFNSKRQRIYDLILPSTEFFPSISQVIVARDERLLSLYFSTPPENRYPANYHPMIGTLNELDMEALTYRDAVKLEPDSEYRPDIFIHAAAKEFANRWIDGHNIINPIVTITVRDMSWQKDRNNIHDNWMALADLLSKRNYTPVFIPDTDFIFEENRNYSPHLSIGPAAWNVALRAGIYDRANLNLGVSTGPMAIPQMSKHMRYLVFKTIVNSASIATEEAFIKRGIDIKKGHNFSGPYQRFYTETDSLENLTRETFAMLESIEKSEDIVWPTKLGH